MNYTPHRKRGLTWLAPWTPDTDMTGVSISDEDAANGSPRDGDMIARNPDNHADRWLVSAEYYLANYEESE